MGDLKVTFHHGKIKEHFRLKNMETNDLILYTDDDNKTYPVIFFDPGKAEEFRRNHPQFKKAYVEKVMGITFYNNGAVEL